jgi:hypothetical protein
VADLFQLDEIRMKSTGNRGPQEKGFDMIGWNENPLYPKP